MSLQEQLEPLQESTEKIQGFLTWFVQKVWRGNDWLKRSTFALATSVILFAPPVVTEVLALFGQALPPQYTWIYRVEVLAVAVTTLVVAVRTVKRDHSEQLDPGALANNDAVRGLLSFQPSQAEVYARLQRDAELREVLRAVADPSFRIGILAGESGCGKSSFLQAGVLPRAEKVGLLAVYVELTDGDPLETIRAQVGSKVALSSVNLSLQDLLAEATRLAGKPLLLLLDQFEQFFIHHRRPADRRSFITSLAAWYRATPQVQGRLLLSIRGDYYDRLIEVQQALGYTLSAHQVLRLERFQPEQALEIIRVLTKGEGSDFDEGFARDVITQELASREEGTVSPVELQILGWMLSAQPVGSRTFTRANITKLGGIEGLLERYLQKSIDAAPHHLRDAALNVLAALADFDANARAGSMSAEVIEQKLQGTVPEVVVQKTLSWLSQPDVRLVRAVEQMQQEGTRRVSRTAAYQLVHERLISTLRKLIRSQLVAADRANELLNRRVREWLDNQKSFRYLPAVWEWRQIESQRPYLAWEPLRAPKEELLLRTSRLWRSGMVVTSLITLSVVGASVWWDSPSGQRYQVKRELSTLMYKQLSGSAVPSLVEALANAGDETSDATLLKQAVEVANGIADPSTKASALSNVAEALAKVAGKTRDTTLLKQAVEAANGIANPDRRAFVLHRVAGAVAKAGGETSGAKLLKQAAEVANGIANPDRKAGALLGVTEAVAKSGDKQQAFALLKQAVEVANGIADPAIKVFALIDVAEAVAKSGDKQQAIALLKQSVEVANSITDPARKAGALRIVAEKLAKAGGETRDATLLKQAVDVADGIANPDRKAFALHSVAKALAKVGGETRDAALLKQAVAVANGIADPGWKASALSNVAEALARAGGETRDATLLKQAVAVANGIADPAMKGFALLGVADALAKAGDRKQAIALLKQVVEVANGIANPAMKGFALRSIADALAKAGGETRDATLLKQAAGVAHGIADPGIKAIALSRVAEALAKAGAWLTARELAQMQTSDEHKALVLAVLLGATSQ